MAWPRLILAVAAVALLGGCAENRACVELENLPSDAEVLVDGQIAEIRAINYYDDNTNMPVETHFASLPHVEGEHIVSVKVPGRIESKAKIIMSFTDRSGPSPEGQLAFLCFPPSILCYGVNRLVIPYHACTEPPELNFSFQHEGQGFTIYSHCQRGFRVYLDGKFVGETERYEPLSRRTEHLVVKVTEPGTHLVEAKKFGFKDWKQTINVEKDVYWLLSVWPEWLVQPQETK